MALPGVYYIDNLQIIGTTNTIPSFEYDGAINIASVVLKVYKVPATGCCSCSNTPIAEYSTVNQDGLSLDGPTVHNEFDIDSNIYSEGSYEGIYFYTLNVEGETPIYPFIKIKFSVANI